MRSLLIFFIAIFSLHAEIRIITEDYPPQNYIVNGELKGVATNIVKEIQQKINNSDKIEMMDWDKGYESCLKGPRCMIFATARIKERLNLFSWVGPITSIRTYFFKKKETRLNIKDIEDAKRVARIAAVNNDADYTRLLTLGFKNIIPVSSQEEVYALLTHGKVDLVISDFFRNKMMLKKSGSKSDFAESTGVLLQEFHLYLAFSKDISDEEIKRWQDAFDAIKESGKQQQMENAAILEAFRDFGLE